jgi:predicted AAA+ superfamily ATPase
MDRSLAKELIADWHSSKIPPLVQREIEFFLPKTKKAIAVIGPRRSGKSFFLYQIALNLLDVPKERTLFISLEDHRFGVPKLEDLDLILSLYFEKYPRVLENTFFLFLDEPQLVDGWERFVRSVLDRYDTKVFLTGSSSKLLSKEIATSMRGRSVTYVVLPFSFREYLKVNNIDPIETHSGKAKLRNALRSYLKFGGFPEVVLEENDILKRKLLRQYVETMLFRDIVERYEITNIKVLKLLMEHMIRSSSGFLSLNRFNNFVKSLGMRGDKNLPYDLKEHLIDAYGFIEVKKGFTSLRNGEQTQPKIYPIDTGYMTDYGIDLDDNIGRFMETCVAVELTRRSEASLDFEIRFWKDRHEVDFVLVKGGIAIQLIQVCYDPTEGSTLKREIDGLMDGSKSLGCKDLTILTWDIDKDETIEGKKVKFVPLWKWLIQPLYGRKKSET